MKNLTATGQHWGSEPDEFDRAVAIVMEVAGPLGVDEPRVRHAMRTLVGPCENPQFDAQRAAEYIKTELEKIARQNAGQQ